MKFKFKSHRNTRLFFQTNFIEISLGSLLLIFSTWTLIHIYRLLSITFTSVDLDSTSRDQVFNSSKVRKKFWKCLFHFFKNWFKSSQRFIVISWHDCLKWLHVLSYLCFTLHNEICLFFMSYIYFFHKCMFYLTGTIDMYMLQIWFI